MNLQHSRIIVIMHSFIRYINKIFKAHHGATGVEYGAITGMIAFGMIVGVQNFGSGLNQSFCSNLYSLAEVIDDNSKNLYAGCPRPLAANIVVNGPFENSGIFLEAGQTIEITPRGEWLASQYRNNPNRFDDPFNSANDFDASASQDLRRHSTMQQYHKSIMGAQIISDENAAYDTHYRHNPNQNMAIAQNGKITITAQQDGYLYMGIHDSYAADNSYQGETPKVNIFLTDNG